MIVGGIDIIVPVPPDVPAAELILDRVRRLWPHARFIDADEVDSHAIDSPWVQTRGASSDEFLIYRDGDAMESWQRDGLTPTNANLMLHFLIRPLGDGSRELTLVCDSRAEFIEHLLRDLESDFQAVSPGGLDRPRAI